jgi:pimeloyl-ACP methyl ester carboxylesterase
VVTVDQAGHSQSGKDRDPWTVGSLAADVGSIVKNLELKRVILIGHSMGGPIGLAAAKQLPGKVIAVIGIDTLQNAEFKMPEDVSKQMVANFTADFKGAMRTTFKGLLTQSADPALLQWLSAKAESQEPKMAITLIREIFAADTKTLMSEAKVPVRCINSSGGYQFFTPTAVDANAKYADYKVVFIDNVGHYPMLEKPDEFNRQLRTVLTEFMAKK